MPPIDGPAEPKSLRPPSFALGAITAVTGARQHCVAPDARNTTSGTTEEVTPPPSLWPEDHSPPAKPRTRTRAALIEAQAAVAIIRFVEVGGFVVASSTAWTASYASGEEALQRFLWLDARPAACTRLGSHAQIFGPEGVSSVIEVGVEVERARAAEKRIRVAEEADADRRRAEEEARLANSIDSWLVDRKGQFGLNLRRGNAKEPFWVILFRERWERERFRDWFRWQRHRFAEWAEFLETHESIELERLLLSEMLQTERAMKKAGLSNGGRRPLRFWRGDL